MARCKTAPKSGSASWRSSRSSVSDGGRALFTYASFATSSVFASRIRTMSATIAVMISTKRSAAIISFSHVRTFSMSGAYGEVIEGVRIVRNV